MKLRRRNFREAYAYILRHRLLFLLIALLTIIIIFPFTQENFPRYTFVMEALFTVTLIASIFVVSRNKNILTVAILIAILAPIVLWFNFFIQSRPLLAFAIALEITFFTMTAVTIITHVLQYRRVTADKIYGAICAYLLIGIIFSLAYTAVEIIQPAAFYFSPMMRSTLQHSTDIRVMFRDYLAHFLYFSYVTLTTLGYGDITPVTSIVRALASIEAMIGKLYVAVLISRLVGLQISHSRLMQSIKKEMH